ncbi:hypothetical protein MCEMSHM24_01712 [Comamonadaceae bacterium]
MADTLLISNQGLIGDLQFKISKMVGPVNRDTIDPQLLGKVHE